MTCAKPVRLEDSHHRCQLSVVGNGYESILKRPMWVFQIHLKFNMLAYTPKTEVKPNFISRDPIQNLSAKERWVSLGISGAKSSGTACDNSLLCNIRVTEYYPFNSTYGMKLYSKIDAYGAVGYTSPTKDTVGLCGLGVKRFYRAKQ